MITSNPSLHGSPSPQMITLMNSRSVKPSFIVHDCMLAVWRNVLTDNRDEHWPGWRHRTPSRFPDSQTAQRREFGGGWGWQFPPGLELQLLRAYKAFYEQLQSESPVGSSHGPINATHASP